MSKNLATAFQALYNRAKESSEESKTSAPISPPKKVKDILLETLGDAAKAARVASQKAKLNFNYFDQKAGEGDLVIDSKTTVTTVVNWLADMLKDVIDKINDQGELMAAIMKKLREESNTSNEELREKHDALVVKCMDLEKRLDEIVEHTDDGLKQKQVDLEQKTSDLEAALGEKVNALDKKYDEVRQRGLKGNLIISSPERTTRGGYHIPSLARHDMFWDCFDKWRCETDMEMVQRLIEMKTGLWVHERDITAQ